MKLKYFNPLFLKIKSIKFTSLKYHSKLFYRILTSLQQKHQRLNYHLGKVLANLIIVSEQKLHLDGLVNLRNFEISFNVLDETMA